MRRLITALAVCLALGCAASSGGADGGAILPPGIKRGMSAAEVKARLGEPAQIEKGGPEESEWYYENGVIVFLRQGKVCFVGRAEVPRQ